MSEAETLRVALIGCGQIARMHLGALLEVPGLEVVAVCDRDEQRARATARLREGVQWYNDLAQLLQEVRPDAVHILTPPATHATLAIQSMRAGCHVLVEKPMALSSEDAKSMITVATEQGVKLGTNHNYLFKPSIQKARELVRSGAIGRVVYVDSYYGLAGESGSYGGVEGTHWAHRLPGGAFTNFLPHLIYLQMEFLSGLESVAGVVLSHGGADSGFPTEMTVLVQGRAASGSMAISMLAKPYAKFIDIYGTNGIIHADLVREICTLHQNRRLPRMLGKVVFALEDSLQLSTGVAQNAMNVLTGRMRDMPELPIIFGKFYDSIRNDLSPPVSGDEGRRMVEVLEEVWSRSPTASAAFTPISELPTEPKTRVESRVSDGRDLSDRVLVTGASGFLGRHLTAALRRCGADVVALIRDSSRASADLERQAMLVEGNICDRALLAKTVEGVSTVFHCAAVTSNAVPWELHYETNVLGTEALLEAALKAGVKRFVHVSSVIVYGLDGSSAAGSLPESAPYASNIDHWSFYLRSKIEAESLAFEFQRRHGLDLSVVRLGILYGPGGRPIGKGLVQIGPVHLLAGSARNELPYTYIDNAVDALLLAAVSPKAGGEAFNVVDAANTNVRECILLRAKLAGERAVLLSVPVVLWRVAAHALEVRASRVKSTSPPKLSQFVVRSAARNTRYDTRKAREELGWQSEVGLQQGLLRTLKNLASESRT